MRRLQKCLAAIVLVITLIAASIPATTFADDGQNTKNGQNNIWTIIAQAFHTSVENVKSIFNQPRGNKPPAPASDNATDRQPPTGENREELTLEQIDKLVTDGQITQAQADEYKAWLAQRPDGPFVDRNRMENLLKEGKITQAQFDAWKTWHDAKPDIQLPRLNDPNRNGPRQPGNK